MFSRVSLAGLRTLKSGTRVSSRIQNLNPGLSALYERNFHTSNGLKFGGSSKPTGLVDKDDEKFVVRYSY